MRHRLQALARERGGHRGRLPSAVGAILLMALCAVPAVWARGVSEAPKAPDAAAVPAPIATENARPAATFTDFGIYNTAGARIGTVDDVIIDLPFGYAAYVVARFSDYVDESGAEYPIPINYFRVLAEEQALYVNVTAPSDLAGAPTMEQLRSELQPTGGRSISLERARTYWGGLGVEVPPVDRLAQAETVGQNYFQNIGVYIRGGGVRLLPGTYETSLDLAGRRVYNEAGVEIAAVLEPFVDLQTGHTPYLLIRTPADPGVSEEQPERYIVPLGAFTLNQSRNELIMNDADALLRGAPSFAEGNAPDYTAPEWDDEIKSYWLRQRPRLTVRSGVRTIPGEDFRYGALSGFDVLNPAGETLGYIYDVIVDRGGDVPYVVLAMGQAFRNDDHLYLVPTSGLTIDTYNRHVLMNLDRGILSEVEGYAEGDLPIHEGGWQKGVQARWRTVLYGPEESVAEELTLPVQLDEDDAAAALESEGYRIGEFMNYTVSDRQGERIGRVEDIVIDLERSAVDFVVVATDGFLTIGEKYFAVPLTAMDPELTEEEFILNRDARVFEEAPGFDRDDWPDTGNPRWDDEIESFWAE